MIAALLLGCALNLALLALAFVPLERAFPARRQGIIRRETGLDLTFLVAQYLLWNGLAALVLRAVQAGVGPGGPVLGDAPFALQAAAALVLGDVLVYWFHRACHRFDWLWRIHEVHHGVERLDWVAAYREHPIDGLLTQLCANLPAFLLGFAMADVAAVVVLRGLWAVFIHSNVRLPLGPLALVLGDPALHHWHHARVERTRHNFANIAPWLDLLFGTHHRPARGADYVLGVPGGARRGYLGHLTAPFRRRRSMRSSVADVAFRRGVIYPIPKLEEGPDETRSDAPAGGDVRPGGV